MEKITDVDSKKINLKPKSYSENKGIWSLMHFNDLKNDFVNSLDFLMVTVHLTRRQQIKWQP